MTHHTSQLKATAHFELPQNGENMKKLYMNWKRFVVTFVLLLLVTILGLSSCSALLSAKALDSAADDSVNLSGVVEAIEDAGVPLANSEMLTMTSTDIRDLRDQADSTRVSFANSGILVPATGTLEDMQDQVDAAQDASDRESAARARRKAAEKAVADAEAA